MIFFLPGEELVDDHLRCDVRVCIPFWERGIRGGINVPATRSLRTGGNWRDWQPERVQRNEVSVRAAAAAVLRVKRGEDGGYGLYLDNHLLSTATVGTTALRALRTLTAVPTRSRSGACIATVRGRNSGGALAANR